MENLFLYGLPLGALLIAGFAACLSFLDSRRFDRRYGTIKENVTPDLFDKRHA